MNKNYLVVVYDFETEMITESLDFDDIFDATVAYYNRIIFEHELYHGDVYVRLYAKSNRVDRPVLVRSTICRAN